VLKIISRSAFDLQTVFDTLTSSACELCAADQGIVFLRRDDEFHASATHGVDATFLDFLKRSTSPTSSSIRAMNRHRV
jgi:hypothetical protein